jgi:hypothetical protein
MEAEAWAKRHSMTGEAISVGARAGAYRTLLTHFSQRYPKMPVVDASFAASTCIASDLMSFNLTGTLHSPLPYIPCHIPTVTVSPVAVQTYRCCRTWWRPSACCLPPLKQKRSRTMQERLQPLIDCRHALHCLHVSGQCCICFSLG